MKISTREYLSLIKRGTPESLAQYNKEVERLDGLMLGAVPRYDADPVQGGSSLSVPERYVEALEKIRNKYDTLIRLYEEERARCVERIQHLHTAAQSQAVFMYVIENKSWEQIACTRYTTFEAARALVLRGFEVYEELYGPEQDIDERIYRA